MNLSLSCKVKQFISVCKFICKNLANYQLCIRFHLNFTMRRRHGCRTPSTAGTIFRVRSRSASAIRTAASRRRSSSTAAAFRCPKGAAPRYGSRARLVGIPHHASRGRSAQRLRLLRAEALRVIRLIRSGHPSGPGAAAGTCRAAGGGARPRPARRTNKAQPGAPGTGHTTHPRAQCARLAQGRAAERAPR